MLCFRGMDARDTSKLIPLVARQGPTFKAHATRIYYFQRTGSFSRRITRLLEVWTMACFRLDLSCVVFVGLTASSSRLSTSLSPPRAVVAVSVLDALRSNHHQELLTCITFLCTIVYVYFMRILVLVCSTVIQQLQGATDRIAKANK
jgi:hypothetical protein